MDDEIVKPKKKVKKIPVKIIKGNVGNMLVEYKLDGILQRATVPSADVEDGAIPEDLLMYGIPYGIPWEGVKLSASVKELANELRANNIWTYEDVMISPNKIISVLQAVYGVDLAALIKYARENK